ncbi:MAG: restriction endonuclease subunit S [Bacilli bacterium]|nr:restriction endonuclease subunit S [Bacilli bacterium]
MSQQSNDSNLPKVEFEDIVSGEGRLNKDISHKFDSRKGTVFEPEFILYGKLRPYLKNWLFPNFKGIALGDFWVFEPNNSSSIFDYYLIQSDKYQTVANISSGTKMPRSDWKTVSETVFSIPDSINEQEKIGAFFKHLDNTIALHQRKLTLLKQLKQTYLQALFPQSELNIPTLRFARFSDSWEHRKVSSLAKETFGGGTPKTGVKKYWKGSFPWIQSSDLTTNQLHNVQPTKFITEEAIKQSATHNVPGNSIAIVTRVGVGKLALMRSSYSTSQDFLSLSNLNVDAVFGVYCLYKMLQREVNNIQGTSIKGITKADLLGKCVSVPTKVEEQVKIGAFFKKIDDTIDFHESKLKHILELKKAFLEKMFL